MDNTNDRVQLKQEEVVGSEVVLKDINPKTSSKSVDDSSTGVPLDKTIERIWNAINNKLSRIVNSVNGRTGVVVLNSEDVGLGNVDNVSFADIKEWVINKLKQEFGNKRIRLYDDMAGLAQDIALNDESIRDSAFYCDHQDENERRACIGYIYWDEGESRLSYMAKYINTIGSTDNSIIYNEKLGTVENGDVRDYTGGKIGVNIYKGEEALELYNGGNKNESGLRINQSKLGGKLVFFDGVYGNGSTDDDTALLYFDASKTPSDAKRVNIYIDDASVGSYAIRRTDLNVGDIIQCNFAGDEYIQDDGYSIPSGMAPLLMYRHPAIGRVTQAPSLKNPNQMYIIEFHTIRPNLGWGLKYLSNHNVQSVGTPTKSSPSELTMKLTQGTTDGSGSNMGNVSGLQVYKGDSDPAVNGVGVSNKLKDAARYTVLPQGPVKVYDSSNTEFTGGLSITPDMSLCVMPVRRYSSTTSIVQSCNWKLKSPMDLSEIRDMSVSSGTLMDMSLLGINLMKVVDNASPLKFSNASGLRISSPIDNDNVSAEWFGLTDTEYNKYLESIGSPSTVKNSGGLSVNVGKFLEISPSVFKNDGEYYDGGKVNVRISKGLTEDPDSKNKIMVNIGKGLNFTGLVNDKKINVAVDEGLEIDSLTNEVNVKLGKTSVYVDEHTGLPFTKEGREVSRGLMFDDTSGVGINVGYGITQKGLTVYPDPKYDDRILYGYLYEGEFYQNESHSESSKYEPDTTKIYINVGTSGTQVAYQYNSLSKTYIKTLLDGVIGVHYDKLRGLDIHENSGDLYVKTGPGMTYAPTVYSYGTGKSYMNDSIVYLTKGSDELVKHEGTYIVTVSTKYYTAQGSSYDISNGLLCKYLVKGYYSSGTFYSNSSYTTTIDPTDSLYCSSTIFVDIPTNAAYNYANGAYKRNYTDNTDESYYKYLADKEGGLTVKLPSMGCLSIWTNGSIGGVYSTGDLVLNCSDGLTIHGGVLKVNYGNGLQNLDGNVLSVKTTTNSGLNIDGNGLGIKLKSYPGLDIDSGGLGIKLSGTSGMGITSSGLSLAIDGDYFTIDTTTGKLTLNKSDAGKKAWKDYLGISST